VQLWFKRSPDGLKVRNRFPDFVGLDAIVLADIEQYISPRFKPLFSRIAAGTAGRQWQSSAHSNG